MEIAPRFRFKQLIGIKLISPVLSNPCPNLKLLVSRLRRLGYSMRDNFQDDPTLSAYSELGTMLFHNMLFTLLVRQKRCAARLTFNTFPGPSACAGVVLMVFGGRGKKLHVCSLNLHPRCKVAFLASSIRKRCGSSHMLYCANGRA